MILINLLPHREAARKRRKEQFFTHLGASALLGGLIGGAVFTWYQGQIAAQQERNQFLQTEISKLGCGNQGYCIFAAANRFSASSSGCCREPSGQSQFACAFVGRIGGADS